MFLRYKGQKSYILRGKSQKSGFFDLYFLYFTWIIQKKVIFYVGKTPQKWLKTPFKKVIFYVGIFLNHCNTSN